MKKKIKIKGLPKAQYDTQNKPAPMVLAPQYLDTWKKDNPANPWGNPPAAFDNPFAIATPDFIYNTNKPTKAGEFIKPMNMGPITGNDYYANLAEQRTAAPKGTRFDENAAYAPGTSMPSDFNKIPASAGNPNKNALSLVGPAMLAGLSGISSLAKKAEQRNAQKEFKDQFLADNLYLSRPESISGNRGDYEINTGVFRPDDYVYGMYNKIAQMGGEMKRKVKITGLPQAEYGGTQNKSAVNQLYGNSAYLMNMFSQRQEQEPMQEYNQTLTPDPRSLSVIEAEKGETLVKTGENSTIPEFYKIGGKRHYEGGTPLGPDKATPNSFIYSDTKAMRIKDKDMLASFGLKAKKGGYTPAEISKKFNLNDKQLREGLYDEQDMLRKKTAIMQADNHIANLGKLALVQESQKGFPQGIPSIAYPYMEKIGMDPMSIMPTTFQQNQMDNYGNLPEAQIGASVLSPSDRSKTELERTNLVPNNYSDWWKVKDAIKNKKPLPSIDEFMTAKEAYNSAKFEDASAMNPLNWGSMINYGLTGQYEPIGVSYAKNYPDNKLMSKVLNFGTEPVNMALAARFAPYLTNRIASGLAGLNFQSAMSRPEIIALKDASSRLGALGDMTISQIKNLAPAAALSYLIGSSLYEGEDKEEKQVALLNKLDQEQFNTLMSSPESKAISSDTIKKAATTNPNINYESIPEAVINVKKPNISKPATKQKTSEIIYEETGETFAYGGEYQTDGNVEPIKQVKGSDGSIKYKYRGQIYDDLEEAKAARSGERTTYTDEDKEVLRKINSSLVFPEDFIEKNQPGTSTGTYGRFDPAAANKNWSWYGKPIDYTKPEQVGPAMKAYNKELYNRFKKAGYTDEEAKRYVKKIGFDEDLEKGTNALDALAGKYFESRVMFNPTPKERKATTPVNDERQLQQTADLSKIEEAKRRPIGYYPEDVLNTAFATANLASINKYLPRQVQFTPELMEPTFYDPTRELAANAEMANIAAQNLAQFTGPQAFNARYSDVQGRGLTNAANVMGRYNNLNVGVANQFETANKQLMNEANFKNQLMADDFYTKTTIANQQYDNAKRQGTEQIMTQLNAARSNRDKAQMVNMLNDNYYYNPATNQVLYTKTTDLQGKKPETDMVGKIKSIPGWDGLTDKEKELVFKYYFDSKS